MNYNNIMEEENYERTLSTGSDENDDVNKNKEIEMNELNNITFTTNDKSFRYNDENSSNNSRINNRNNTELKIEEFKEVKNYKFGNTYQFFFKDGIPIIVIGPHCKF